MKIIKKLIDNSYRYKNSPKKKINLNKKFDREIDKNIILNKKKMYDFLFNILKNDVYQQYAYELTKKYLKDINQALLEDIENFKNFLQSMETDNEDFIKFRNEKLIELESIQNNIKNISNG